MSPPSNTDKCERCQRKGLAFFPVLYAAAPQTATALPPIIGNFGKGVTDKALQASRYFLRSLPAGYLYLLLPNNIWRGYLVDEQGAMKYYPNLTLEDMPEHCPDKPYAQTCERSAHNTAEIQSFTIDGAEVRAPVWAAFSRHRWSRQSRALIARNPGLRMQLIPTLDGRAFDHAETVSSAKLKQHVANFNSVAVAQIRQSLNGNFHLHDLSGQEESITRHMRACSGALNTPGLILALPDPIGITAALNNMRNILWEEEAELERRHEKETFALSAIRSLEGQSKVNADFARHWNEKYRSLVRWEQISPFETRIKAERERIAERLEIASADWLAWERGDELKAALDRDFLGAIDHALAFPCAVMWFTAGAGGTEVEREKWLPATIDPDNERNYLWRAAILDRSELGAAIDNIAVTSYIGAKSLHAAIDQWLAEEGRLTGLDKSLRASLISPYARQSLHDAFDKLINALQGAQAAAKDRSRHFMAAMMLSARLLGVELMPLRINEPVRKIIGMQRDVLWQPVAQLFEIQQQTATSLKWQVDVSKLSSAADIPISTSMSATVFVITQVRTSTVWEATALFRPYEQAIIDARSSPATAPTTAPSRATSSGSTGGSAIARGAGRIAAASRNWWAANREVVTQAVSNPRLAGSLSVIAAGFQAISFRQTLEQLDARLTPAEKRMVQLNLYSNALAATGYTVEALAAALQLAKRAAAKAAGEAAVQLLLRRVGMLGALGEGIGGVAGAILTVQTAGASLELVRAGDTDSARFMIGQLAGSIGSTAAGFSAAYVIGATALRGVTVTFLGLGPAGWMLIALAGAIVVASFAYYAALAKDDPLESWLKQSAFGTHSRAEWTSEIQKTRYEQIFALPWTFELSWDVRTPVLESIKHRAPHFDEELRLVSTVPALGDYACLAAELLFSGDDGDMTVNVVLTPQGARHETVPANLAPANQWAMGAHVDGRSRNGMLVLRIIHTQRVRNTAKSATTIQSPRIPRNSGPVFKRVRVSTRFWPDQVGAPQLVLPSDSGRIDTLNARAPHYIARSEAARAEAQERATACYEAGRCSGDTIYW